MSATKRFSFFSFSSTTEYAECSQQNYLICYIISFSLWTSRKRGLSITSLRIFSILFCFHNLHFRSHRRRRRQHRVLTFDLTMASPAHTVTVSLSEKNLPLSFNCQELIAFRSLKMIVCHHLERPFFRLCVSKVKVSHFETKKTWRMTQTKGRRNELFNPFFSHCTRYD